METISTAVVLEEGSKNLGNHPDNLVRRTLLAKILVDSRAVKTPEAALAAFKMWAIPESRDHPISAILNIANERSKPNGDLLHQ